MIGYSEVNDSVQTGINRHATFGISGYETHGKTLTGQTKDCIYKIE